MLADHYCCRQRRLCFPLPVPFPPPRSHAQPYTAIHSYAQPCTAIHSHVGKFIVVIRINDKDLESTSVVIFSINDKII